jgi:hypothetical protein
VAKKQESDSTKVEAGAKIDSLLERIPVLDGGGRRRLTAGTIVVLSAIVLSSQVQQAIKGAISAKEVSLSLFLAAGALLVYATGVIVELVGEVFLARAVANAAWAFVEVARYSRQRQSRSKRFLLRLITPVWGILRAGRYFVLGLLGKSKWRLLPQNRLSKLGQSTFERLPDSLRNAIEQPLDLNAEFGRQALIEHLATPDSRRWARRLMEKPKDVLALISATVLSLLLYLAVTPVRYSLDPSLKSQLRIEHATLEKMQQQYSALNKSVLYEDLLGVNTVSRNSGLVFWDLGGLLRRLVIWTEPQQMADPKDPAFGNPHNPFDIGAEKGFWELLNDVCGADGMIPELDRIAVGLSQSDLKDLRYVNDLHRSICQKLRDMDTDLPNSVWKAELEISRDVAGQYFIRGVAIIAAMFLFVAFFNQLAAVTLSVLEKLAMQEGNAAEREPESSRTIAVLASTSERDGASTSPPKT